MAKKVDGSQGLYFSNSNVFRDWSIIRGWNKMYSNPFS